MLEGLKDNRRNDALFSRHLIRNDKGTGLGARSRLKALHFGARALESRFNRVDKLRTLDGSILKEAHLIVGDGRKILRFVRRTNRRCIIGRRARRISGTGAAADPDAGAPGQQGGKR